MPTEISNKAKNLLPRILEEIQAEGLMNWEVVWLAGQISTAERRSHEMAVFTDRFHAQDQSSEYTSNYCDDK